MGPGPPTKRWPPTNLRVGHCFICFITDPSAISREMTVGLWHVHGTVSALTLCRPIITPPIRWREFSLVHAGTTQLGGVYIVIQTAQHLTQHCPAKRQ